MAWKKVACRGVLALSRQTIPTIDIPTCRRKNQPCPIFMLYWGLILSLTQRAGAETKTVLRSKDVEAQLHLKRKKNENSIIFVHCWVSRYRIHFLGIWCLRLSLVCPTRHGRKSALLFNDSTGGRPSLRRQSHHGVAWKLRPFHHG